MTHHPADARRTTTCGLIARVALVATLALLATACGLRQEVRFDPDGSGSVIGTFAIEERCVSSDEGCSPWARWLLGGEGPVANATAAAETLPFDVLIEPLHHGRTGYTQAFDFESVRDLERKLAPEASSPVDAVTHTNGPLSQTSPFTFSSISFEREGRRSTFSATARLTPCVVGIDPASFAVVLPGSAGEHNADVVREARGGTRFEWDMATEGLVTMRASTIAVDRDRAEPSLAVTGEGVPPVAVAVAAVLLAAGTTIVAFARRRERTRGATDVVA